MKHLVVFFTILLALALVQCAENPVFTEDSSGGSFFKGPGNGGSKGGGNGGGHTETIANNLSFPALCADGSSALQVTTSFTTEYTGSYDGLTAEEIAEVKANGPWYAQKVEGNSWMAENSTVTSASVTFVDWGDAIEAVDPKLGRPYRLELALYQEVQSMSGYTMSLLAFPSSEDETQGTNTSTYLSDYAAITSPKGRIVVQRFDEGAVLTWNGTSWDGADEPVTGLTFAPELNVGGKYIFGASKKGWKPASVGNYRITFYMESSTVVLSDAQVGNYSFPSPDFPSSAENNQPYVDAENNLTYVDVEVNTGGGGGH